MQFDWAFIPEHFFDQRPAGQGAHDHLPVGGGAVLRGAAGAHRGADAAQQEPRAERHRRLLHLAVPRHPAAGAAVVFATGLYQIGIHWSLLAAALLALSINEGAYMAEIIRAGIQSIDPGQMEAGQVARHDLWRWACGASCCRRRRA